MIVRKEIDINRELSEEEKAMLRRAKEMPIVYDEDSPELTDEQLAQFKLASELRREERVKKTVTIRLSPKALAKAKSLGKGYTSILSRMLEEALNDNDFIQRCL